MSAELESTPPADLHQRLSTFEKRQDARPIPYETARWRCSWTRRPAMSGSLTANASVDRAPGSDFDSAREIDEGERRVRARLRVVVSALVHLHASKDEALELQRRM